jgi:hypothetical protein
MEQVRILRAFITLLDAPETVAAHDALELIVTAAQEGDITEAIQTICEQELVGAC